MAQYKLVISGVGAGQELKGWNVNDVFSSETEVSDRGITKMSRIILSDNQRIVDHSYSIARGVLEAIEWIDDETGDYGWQVLDTTKNQWVEKIGSSVPGQLQIFRK